MVNSLSTANRDSRDRDDELTGLDESIGEKQRGIDFSKASLKPEGAPIAAWVASKLDADVQASLEKLAATDDVARVAAMPDVHISGQVCNGAVVGTMNTLYPQAVGGDIGCGVSTIQLCCSSDILANERNAAVILRGLYDLVPGAKHGRDTKPDMLPEMVEASGLSDPSLAKQAVRDGLYQIGTLGCGNHFVELQKDDEGGLWVMVHSGSRSMGPTIADFHLKRAGIQSSSGLQGIDASSDAGQAYLNDMQWAMRYAASNRDMIMGRVAEIFEKNFGVTPEHGTRCSCHHNFARQETHNGQTMWVHRKGAISAADGEAGLIPGSMGTASFHVEGRGNHEAMSSSSHGAGRRISRGEAANVLSVKDLKRDMEGVWYDHRMASRLVDESPAAYKDIFAVMRAQRELTRQVRVVRPVLNFKTP